MSAMAKLGIGKFYRAGAGAPERPPWQREQPSAVLQAEAQDAAGRALDVSCELKLKSSGVSALEAPLPFGPVVRGMGSWFQPA